MKIQLNRKRHVAGLTLLEMAAAILVLLIISGALFFGIQGYVNGTNRATCVLNRSNIQKAVRTLSGMYQLNIGDAMTAADARLTGAVGVFPAMPVCPTAGAAYTVTGTIPAIGVPYVTSCPVGATHNPTTTAGW